MRSGGPRIFDCFTFNGEHDLLWLRSRVLAGVVDRMVIAEADRTFTGKPKALQFDPARLPPDAPPVIYLPVRDLDAQPASAWENENRQRNALARFLDSPPPEIAGGIHDNDWLLLSDVDEIAHPRHLLAYEPRRYLSAILEQRFFFYAFNNESVDAEGRPNLWRRARVTTVRHFRDWYGSMRRLRDYRTDGPLRSVRRAWDKLRTQSIADAGWHFSYLMTPEQIVEKLAAFSHQEFNTPEIASVEFIRKCMAEGRDLFGHGRTRAVPLDSTFPAALQTEAEKFAKFILPLEGPASGPRAPTSVWGAQSPGT
ncbi:MAG TPA: hypothetical protein VHA82_22415 [Ramlibacter sp.]|uniref:hypothetical protein n=1 Tax=Ramlibacter sp. TaxID=1917967 RepID=UPI002B5AF956|nr:hypothetical protein [Ramlibacter sp.]HVZ46576.1 hypothetical protein [Ramlibacter sp.]